LTSIDENKLIEVSNINYVAFEEERIPFKDKENLER